MYKANDWQDLSLKKNIEKILQAQGKNEAIGVALSFDIAIAVIVLCVDKAIDALNQAASCNCDIEKVLSLSEKLKVVSPFVLLAVLGLGPALVLGVRFLLSRLARHTTVAHIRSIDELVDLFDNELCVYAMMAQSYVDMLLQCDALSSKRVFFYIQACYYINKSINGLIKTQPQMMNVISSDEIDLRTSKLISIDRVVNIIEVLVELINSIKDLDIRATDIKLTKSVNSARKAALEDYNKEINVKFGKKLPTDISQF